TTNGIRLHTRDGVIAHDNTLSANTVTDNGEDGITLYEGIHNLITDNVVLRNGEDGIDLNAADDNQVPHNGVEDNGDAPGKSGIERTRRSCGTPPGPIQRMRRSTPAARRRATFPAQPSGSSNRRTCSSQSS